MTILQSNILPSFAVALTLSFSFAASAADPTTLPGSTQVGQPGLGSDMWTQTMTQLGLFQVHRDDCSAETEVFIEVYTDDNTIQFGFCIEKNERAAQEWEDAKDTCLAAKKRLPEPAEWKFACDIGTGLNSMTNNREWASNFGKLDIWDSSNVRAVTVPAVGDGSCKKTTWGSVMNTGGSTSSHNFRCVR